ncbi:MAG TPA: DUF459 domain-containing protein [Acidimicrobiia bacterium]|nr:DUF459 domain-containing protein [Acidimicrobiia bacterium]
MIPESDESAALSRRHRRHHRRRRTRRGLFAAGALVGALTVAGSALALTGIVEIGRDSNPASARSDAPSPATSPRSTTLPDGDKRPCREPLNPLDPLRLWMGGDSLAGSLGPSLGKLTGDTGVVQPVYLSKVSSGLSSPEFWDWPENAGVEMFKVNPEIAVFIIGANDSGVVQGDAAKWRPQYEQTVEEMMTLLIGDNRTVYWVGAPIFNDGRSEKLIEVNRVFKDVADRHPEVVYVDAYALFATPDGRYTPFIEAEDGDTIRARADDGVHFTPEGGDHLARAIVSFLEPQCSLLAQAVPGMPKKTIETEGSTKVPGTSREEDDDDGTTATTSPATNTTAPPATTAPPVTEPTTTTTTPITTILPPGPPGNSPS